MSVLQMRNLRLREGQGLTLGTGGSLAPQTGSINVMSVCRLRGAEGGA